MSTKMSSSPLNTIITSTPNVTTSTAAAAATSANINSNASMNAVKIKKELPSDEIKEFAENTMNELLGWYGFEGVDRLDLSAKTTRLLQASAGNANNSQTQHHLEKRRSRTNALLQLQQQQNEHIRNIANNNNNHNRKNLLNCNSYRSNTSSGIGGNGGGNSGSIANAGTCNAGNESTTSDHDTRSSREEDSKSPLSSGKTTMEEKIDFRNCCWCRRPVPENAPEFLTTSDGPRYCSESCFTQSRRASFKKAKTCDWCKHVRHAVSYVDFQDGASQLQFCSDKCLNQYKMQIFCKETQAHLDMNPHLREQGLDVAGNGGAGLITPDLWLRNCRSRSASPASTISVSPPPPAASAIAMPAAVPIKISRTSPLTLASSSQTVPSAAAATNFVHKPMISVAPVSKLMSKSPGIMQNRQSPKHSRKKRPLKSCVSGDINSGSGIGKAVHCASTRDLSNLSAVNTSGMSKSKSLLNPNASNSMRNSPANMGATTVLSSSKSTAAALSQFAGSSVQDLHMSVPPLSPMMDQQPHALSHMTNIGGHTNIPPAFFATPSNAGQSPVTAAQLPHATGFAPGRPTFLQNPPIGMLPRFLGGFGAGMQQPPPPPHLMQHDMSGLSTLLGAPPPVTVMVPYPIIIPLPIPIPIPLPVMDFYKAHLSPAEREKFNAQECETTAAVETRNEESVEDVAIEFKTDSNEQMNSAQCNTEEPLDFTKTRELNETAEELKASFDAVTNNSAPAMISEDSVSLEPPVATITNTPSDESSSSTINTKTVHCIVRTDTDHAEKHEVDINHETALSNTSNTEENTNETETDAKQKLPKFKITRLQTKRTLIQTKESECSRPLRKRKRIIDCDFQKIALKESETEEAASEALGETSPTTTTTTTITTRSATPINAVNSNSNHNTKLPSSKNK